MEHCQLCHLHNTTLRHKEEEYVSNAHSYISVLLEAARAAGICARLGVARYGTSVSAMGPPPLSAAISQDRHNPGSPGGYAEDKYEENYEDDADHEGEGVHAPGTPGAQEGSPAGASTKGDKMGADDHQHDHNHCVTTSAGQDLEHADRPMASLSPNLKGFMPQQRLHPPELKDTTERLTQYNKSPPRSRTNKSLPRCDTSPSPAKFNPFAVLGGPADGGPKDQTRRLGAFEIIIMFKPHMVLHGHRHNEEETGEKDTDDARNLHSIKMEMLHSKLASQKWPSRSVLVRRLMAFLGRFDVPGAASMITKGGTAENAPMDAGNKITLSEYPDFHGSGSDGGTSNKSRAMRVSTEIFLISS